MSGLLPDLRHRVRMLRRSPGFTAVAVLTLALGIGATTAMFSMVDGALFRGLRYPHAEELVSVGVIAPMIDGEFLFAGNYLACRRQQTVFSGFTSSSGVNDCDLSDDRPARVTCAAVESSFLPSFGIQPILGRNFTADEDRPAAPKVALLWYGLWQSRLGGDPGVVGRRISLMAGGRGFWVCCRAISSFRRWLTWAGWCPRLSMNPGCSEISWAR